ncbi:MAG: AraC family transcriptional regulator [Hyphomonadaceae bacterium]|nr:AraC family transcriptional regulator [Hyphomonadaceae bacterium]
MSTALRIAYGTFGRVALLDMDRSLVRHAHPHCHVLLKAEGEDTAFAVGDRFIPLTDSQAVLVNAWEPHAYVHDPLRARTTILALYIEPMWLQAIRPNWAASGGPGFFDQPAGEVTPRIRDLGMNLATVMVSDPAGRSAQEELLSDLMISVIERFTPWRTISASLALRADLQAFDWRVRRAVDLIRSAPSTRICVDTLARESGLSRAHFYRLFQRTAQVSPHVYLNVVRMELAVKAVVDSSDSLAVVSDTLGFSAPAHFARFFREHAGVKPSEFRVVSRMGLA